MATFTCYLPEGLLQRLDEQVQKTPRGSRSGILRQALEEMLDGKPTSVTDVFREAVGGSRADAFRRATQ